MRYCVACRIKNGIRGKVIKHLSVFPGVNLLIMYLTKDYAPCMENNSNPFHEGERFMAENVSPTGFIYNGSNDSANYSDSSVSRDLPIPRAEFDDACIRRLEDMNCNYSAHCLADETDPWGIGFDVVNTLYIVP